MKISLPRIFCTLCLSGLALGTTAATAHEVTPFPWMNDATKNERLAEAAYSDPEGEITNGMDPPIEANRVPQDEADDDLEPPSTDDNIPGERASKTAAGQADPEGEVGNGMNPPNRAPIDPEADIAEDLDPPPTIDLLPELEVGST